MKQRHRTLFDVGLCLSIVGLLLLLFSGPVAMAIAALHTKGGLSPNDFWFQTLQDAYRMDVRMIGCVLNFHGGLLLYAYIKQRSSE